MKMHILSGGRLRMRRSIYFPDADRSETIELPVSCVLLRDARGNVLFDTGCHPSVVEDAAARWGGLAKLMVPLMGPNDNVVAELATLGLAPDDIDVVVCSHLHPDHCGCNAFFKRATVMVHARELDSARAPNAANAGYVAADWDHPLPMDVVSGERDLYGNGRIVLIPLPGHTPGCIAALVALDRTGTVLLAADTVSVRATLDTGVLPKNTWNADALTKSLAEVRRIEARGAMVVCGHDAAQWAGLRKGADAYD
ncbi:MAG TPA: N-acyl homoserine lactonase family protein [Xanthobacteraceae bacterium]|jgi:glyoxylase-like metal-dependent hydrolase (beta-lactamase superfamily II)|nr:N-acyl homoserine lactonase family protein [Xanthobacteraceae bacterium]